ncbi:MAG: sulfonate transport system ATP-binding protein [Thermosediminibacterales bacterium]|nr:sulfonate transport system ATP-binding protein [Thermosediminibacterales bacterium]
MDILLEIKNLSKIYKTPKKDIVALNDINLQVKEKEFVTVIGPSGCGKSTFLRCIAGLEKPSKGEIRINGTCVKYPGRDRMMVFQGLDQLFPWLTVLDNITYPLKLAKRGKNKAERKEIANYFLKLVSLEGAGHLYPYQLSGGMKQRVAIARALSVCPKVLLMDEPFGSLDALTRDNLQKHLIKIWKETGVTIIFVTHNIEEAVILSTRIAVFSTGVIKEIIENHLIWPRIPENPSFVAQWEKVYSLLQDKIEKKEITNPLISERKVNLAF